MQLIKYEAACHALAEAHSIDEVKDWADQAKALEAYAKQANDRQLEIMSAEIRIRAKRRIGELSAALKTLQGARADLTLSHTWDEVGKREALSLAGVSKSEAYRCEQLATVSEEAFEG